MQNVRAYMPRRLFEFASASHYAQILAKDLSGRGYVPSILGTLLLEEPMCCLQVQFLSWSSVR